MRPRLFGILLIAFLFCVVARAPAQAIAQTADSLYLQKDYAAAVRAYQTLLEKDSQNSRAWYRLGVSQQALGNFNQARSDYSKALSTGFPSVAVYYRMATLDAQISDKSAAVRDLTKAFNGVPIDPEQIKDDARFASLQGYAPFVSFLNAADRKFRPCKYDERYRALDFWIGNWNVTNADGSQPYGQNRIESTLEQCVLVENWTGAAGGTGKSFTRYDSASNKWVQHWVDSSGSFLDYEGTLRGKAIVMVAHTVSANGKPELRRMTFTSLPDGRVRQYVEKSADHGKTWNTQFDGYYSRSAPVTAAPQPTASPSTHTPKLR